MRVIRPEAAMSERVANEVRDAILNGSLPPLSRVRQEDLAAKLGVSREPVRHAMAILEREGLIQTIPNRGATVAPVDPGLISDIFEFREGVDGYVAAKIATSIDFDPGPMRAVVKEGRAAVADGDLPRLIELDLAFHNGLYEASGNRVVVDVMRNQWSHLRRVMTATLMLIKHREYFWDQHSAIVEAIARGDAAAAQSLSAAHVSGVRDLLRNETSESGSGPLTEASLDQKDGPNLRRLL